jgi:hypothetical protein
MRLIAGSGRSGTTWVQDALATANGLRPIFEPLHPEVSPVGRQYAFRALSPDESHPELRRFFEETSFGRSHVLWTRYRRQRRWLFPPRERFSSLRDVARVNRLWKMFLKDVPWLTRMARGDAPLVKCIRANLMLGWLRRQFDCRTVLLVRHPGAVVESKLQGHWNVPAVLDGFRGDARFHELTGGRYRSLLDRHPTGVAGMAALWVIENQYAIEHAARDGVTVAFYECLTSKPELEWRRICDALSLSNIPSADVIAKPSQQSSPAFSAAEAFSSDVPRWMRSLTPEQKDEVQGILDQVEFGLYKMSDPEPRLGAHPQPRGDAIGMTR